MHNQTQVYNINIDDRKDTTIEKISKMELWKI